MTGPPDPDGLHADQVATRTIRIRGTDVEAQVVHLGPGGWKWAIQFYAVDNPGTITRNGWAVIGAVGPFLKPGPNGLGYFSTSNRRIAAIVGCDRRTIQRALGELEAVGVLERREKGKGRRGSLYALTCPQPWATKGKDERQAEADADGHPERPRQPGQPDTAPPIGRIIRETVDRLHAPQHVMDNGRTARDSLGSHLKEIYRGEGNQADPTTAAAAAELVIAHEAFTLMLCVHGFNVWNTEIVDGGPAGFKEANRFADAERDVDVLPPNVDIDPWVFSNKGPLELIREWCTDAADFHEYEAGGQWMPVLNHPDLGKWAREATAAITRTHEAVEQRMAEIVEADRWRRMDPF